MSCKKKGTLFSEKSSKLKNLKTWTSVKGYRMIQNLFWGTKSC